MKVVRTYTQRNAEVNTSPARVRTAAIAAEIIPRYTE